MVDSYPYFVPWVNTGFQEKVSWILQGMGWCGGCWVLGAAEEAYAFLVSSSLPPLKFETCGSLCSIETLHLSSVAMNPGFMEQCEVDY